MRTTALMDVRAGTVAGVDAGAQRIAGGSTVVGRALALLDALGSGRPAEPLSVLAARTGMPKSTACRILRMMESLGFVGREDSLYCLGPKVRELGTRAAASTHNQLRSASQSTLEWLYDEAGTTVHLATLTGTDVLCLEKITAPGGSRIPTQAGLTAPAACTAMGKAQLAYADRATLDAVLRGPLLPLTRFSVRTPGELQEELAAIRSTGLAVDRGELRVGVTCVAAPILVRGRMIAAISASSARGPAHTAQRINAVREAARRLSTRLERLGVVSA